MCDPNDYAKLTNALTETGELERAVHIIKEAKDHFTESAEVKLLAAYEAVAQSKLGNIDLAEKALTLALTDDGSIPSESTSLTLAKAC